MPTGALRAYTPFLDALRIRGGLALGVGAPYGSRCSLPQGCPFSMMALALTVRPPLLLGLRRLEGKGRAWVYRGWARPGQLP